ncbi:hypothetical protein CERSUDRAFT_154374 [Gelatoporia subvermispora B]|uniref:Sister chromatid cohesion protein DCC1 n=1 Tax=Ceriporiopsis subvermispora (strain B) TaxID=914234 RepID=M2QKS7_CERS8|nr:hypothetical protein CERSUDRAFT_154374 [Gelatoporia subvermispora B]
MMSEYTLQFSSSNKDNGNFKLLELPTDLCKVVESALEGSGCPSFVIKGQPGEDAVLCTTDKTYTVRSVVLSNSMVVVTPAPASETGDANVSVEIRDQISEVLELLPTVPKLHKLESLLRGHEYDEGDIDDMYDEDEGRPTKRRRYTYEDISNNMQASEDELMRGLRERRILTLNGELRPVTPAHLTAILEILLNTLVSLSLPHDAAPTDRLVDILVQDHDMRRDVATQVMSWFGSVADDAWEMDVEAVVKEVGLGILRLHKDDPIAEGEFLQQWRKAVGDTFESSVSLQLLLGNYLSEKSMMQDLVQLKYFPASALPIEPAARFSDLFLTRDRWKADDLTPFLADIAVDSKERDKLLLKHARALTDAEGVWYTARVKYNA